MLVERTTARKEELLGGLPESIFDDANIERCLAQLHSASGRKVVVLDDDPTGTQTVNGVNVVTQWDVQTITRLFESPERTFYISTNSRSLPQGEAVRLAREVTEVICEASLRTDVGFSIVSRSDSTLRGHFPAETDACLDVLYERLGRESRRVLLVPAFFEAGRYTINDVQWVEYDEKLVPVGQTEFARDPVFGFKSSNLFEWVEEKTQSKSRRQRVFSLSIDMIRQKGPKAICSMLMDSPNDAIVIANAACYEDLQTLCCGVMLAEQEGLDVLYRTSSSFVPIYGGITIRQPMTKREIRELIPRSNVGGLVVVGSHVNKTTQQLKKLISETDIDHVELTVHAVVSESTRQEEIDRVVKEVAEWIESGKNAVVYTSREVTLEKGNKDYQDISQAVSRALVDVVRSLKVKPRFVLSKGGITSIVLAKEALGARQAHVRGQVLPGVPLWELASDSPFGDMPFIVFPGNVGDEDALVTLMGLIG